MNQHEIFIKQAYQLAREAVAHGNHPFGALLVKDGAVILTAENSIYTDHDVTRHAELNLVSAAAQRFEAETLAQCTLYTSTEPCAMCTGAIYWAGIAMVVFGCSAAALGEIAGGSLAMPCAEILARGKRPTAVIGPILEAEGVQIHQQYWPSVFG
ncbi:MAG: nucleoside deaminase [Ardenticatenaceae bacterium]|nr:nucleoside deaminase [Ardenticatenaceae bacterium]